MNPRIRQVVDYVKQHKPNLGPNVDYKIKIAAAAAILAGSLAFVGYKLYPFNPFSNKSTPAATSSTLSRGADNDDNEITVTILGNDCPPAAVCPTAVNPLEALLTSEQNYVEQNSWKNIVGRYAGVPGGVIVSLQDYQGNDKEQACKLALGRLVETTIGSVADRNLPQYRELSDAVIAKGLNDCKKSIDLRYREVRFGL